MLDVTRLARTLGFVFAGYFAGWLVVALIVIATGFDRLADWWTWPVPCIFPVLSAVLTVDFFRRLRNRRLTPSQVGGYRSIAVMLALGAGFALSRYWEPLALGALIALPMFFPAKKRAAAATGER